MSDITVDNNEQPAVQNPADSVINLTDLQNVLVIFDLASSRGAFRGAELEPIGVLYGKINKFLQLALPPQPAADAPVEGNPESDQLAVDSTGN